MSSAPFKLPFGSEDLDLTPKPLDQVYQLYSNSRFDIKEYLKTALIEAGYTRLETKEYDTTSYRRTVLISDDVTFNIEVSEDYEGLDAQGEYGVCWVEIVGYENRSYLGNEDVSAFESGIKLIYEHLVMRGIPILETTFKGAGFNSAYLKKRNEQLLFMLEAREWALFDRWTRDATGMLFTKEETDRDIRGLAYYEARTSNISDDARTARRVYSTPQLYRKEWVELAKRFERFEDKAHADYRKLWDMYSEAEKEAKLDE